MSAPRTTSVAADGEPAGTPPTGSSEDDGDGPGLRVGEDAVVSEFAAMPLASTPPHGSRGANGDQPLTATAPAWSAADTVWARDRSVVQTVAARPYRLSFASATASAASSNGITVPTGPKISSRAIVRSFVPARTVGWTKKPGPSGAAPPVTRWRPGVTNSRDRTRRACAARETGVREGPWVLPGLRR